MMGATKFRFETSFDNGAHAAASAAELARKEMLVEAATEGEARGFARGHEQAMSEVAAQTQSLLHGLCAEMAQLFESIDTVKRQLVVDAATVASVTGGAIGGRLMERLPEERIAMLMEDLIHDIVDAPRLVLRVSSELLDSTRASVESITQAHGFAGRLIFLAEPNYNIGDITIEWAHGGLSYDAVNQHQLIESSVKAFVDSVLNGGDIAVGTEV